MAEMNKSETNAIDFKAELEKALADEAADVEKYMNLSDYAKTNHPDCPYAQVLKDIAMEEKTHHKHIRMILSSMEAKETESKWT